MYIITCIAYKKIQICSIIQLRTHISKKKHRINILLKWTIYKPLFDSDQVILYTGSIVETASLLLWTKSGKPFEDSSSNETVFTTYSFCNSDTLFVRPCPFSPGQLWRSEPAVLRFLRGWLAIESAERFLQWIHQQSLETHNIFYM